MAKAIVILILVFVFLEHLQVQWVHSIYVDPTTNRSVIGIGFIWAKYYYPSLLNANASTTLPAILYGLNTIDTIMPGRFNFTYALQ